jgi:hypothetical protein
MYVPGRDPPGSWFYGRREKYGFNFKKLIGGAMKLAGPVLSMTPAGALLGKVGGLASGVMGAVGGASGLAEGAALVGAGALGARMLGGGSPGGAGGGIGAPGGSSGGGSGPISITSPPVKINIQVSGSDMAASSGVFEEDIGTPGITNNTVPEPVTKEEGAPGTSPGDGGGKKDRPATRGRQPARGGGPARGGFGRRRYTEEFSGGGVIPHLEESDIPLLIFAIIATLLLTH